MRSASFFALFSCLLSASILFGQSTAELDKRFKNPATSKQDKMNIAYQLASQWKKSTATASKAADYAWQANQLAIEVGDKRREAEAANLSADAMFIAGNLKVSAERYVQAWNAARNYGLRDLAINCADRLQEIARKKNDQKEELKWSREMVNYLKDSGGGTRGGGDAQRRLENQLAAAEAKIRELADKLAQATGQSQSIETNYQAQLKEVQAKSQQQITEITTQKEATINDIELKRQKADSVANQRGRDLALMSREQLEAAMQIETQRRSLAESQLKQTENENQRNVLALIAGFVMLIAILFYIRYRAKNRTAAELSEKNTRIEEEQKRSDNLLLNILPPAIAQELKTRNKVAAQKYEQATVLFLDFKGFTNVAEQLSPELLVEELDFCFSNFDRIISQYRIEKIKTIGDAYLCASGLSDKNDSPSDMVKAALEIQDFLLHIKAERLDRGMPFFEARAGIHTGPVVAGVVGSKKFAYDIWGDTVNTAARMQEACEPGRVNVSETSYWLAKYEFEWQSRGKIAAKNKGMMDMYYVTGIKSY